MYVDNDYFESDELKTGDTFFILYWDRRCHVLIVDELPKELPAGVRLDHVGKYENGKQIVDVYYIRRSALFNQFDFIGIIERG